MENITIIEGADLKYLAAVLDIQTKDIYRVRIANSASGGIKVKVNEGMWTPALGKADARG